MPFIHLRDMDTTTVTSAGAVGVGGPRDIMNISPSSFGLFARIKYG